MGEAWRAKVLSWRADPRLPTAALLAALFAVALAVRLSVAAELADEPLFRAPQLDAREFHDWATRIAGGDFTLPRLPTHGLPYPLLLGALLAAGDGSLELVRSAQSVLGAATVLLVALAALRLWQSRVAAATAGLAAALHAPLVLVDVSLWEDGLLACALAALLALLAGGGAGVARGVAAGAALGLAIAIRPTALVLLPLPALAWLRRGAVSRGSDGVRATAAALVAATLVVTPFVIVASRAAGGFLFVRGTGAINLWIGNDPAGGGVQNARIGGGWDRLEAEPLRAGVTSAVGSEEYFARRTLERAADDPFGLARALASKTVWLFSAEEPRDNHSLAFFRAASPTLARLPGFGLVLALGGAGLAIARCRGELPVWLPAALLLLAVPVLIALAGLRYRLPMTLGWMLLAGAAARELAERLRTRSFRNALVLVVAQGALFVASHARKHAPTHVLAEEWALSGEAALASGEIERARSAFARARDSGPGSSLGPDGLARIEIRSGNERLAEAYAREAIRREPDALRPRLRLADLLRHRGERVAALAEVERALAVNPLWPPALERAAILEEELGRSAAAHARWALLARLVPGDARLESAAARTASGSLQASADRARSR